MAKYRIKSPEGAVYEITAPDDATEEQVLAYAQENFQSAPKAAPGASPQPQEAPDPTEGMSTFDKVRAGFAKSFVDTGRGLKQAATDNLRRGTSAARKYTDAFGIDMARDLAAGIDDSVAGYQAKQRETINESRRLDAPLMGTAAGIGGNIGGQLSQMALLPVGGGAGLAGKFATSAAQGAAFSGAQPVATGESRLGNSGQGAAWGLVGQGLASGASKTARAAWDKLPKAVRDSIELARRADIPLHVSQTTQSFPIKAAASAAKWLPFSGASSALRKQQEAFNSALGRSFGAKDARYLTDDVMRDARKRIGGVFEGIYNRNDINLTPDALRKLVGIESSAARRLTADEAQVLRNQLDDILANAENGVLSGQKYQAVRTAMQKAEGSDKIGGAVKDLRKALDDIAAEAVGPEDAARLAKSRGQWANMRVVEDALKQVGGAAGNVRPSSLWPLIRKGSTKEMRELAKIGQNVLKDVVNDSGSAQRQFYTNMLTGGAGAAGAAGAANLGLLGLFAKAAGGGALAGRALNSKTAAKMLEQGKPSKGLAALMKPAPKVLPVVGPLATQGLEIGVSGGRVGTPEELALDQELVRGFRAGTR